MYVYVFISAEFSLAVKHRASPLKYGIGYPRQVRQDRYI